MGTGWDEWIIVLIPTPGETKQENPFSWEKHSEFRNGLKKHINFNIKLRSFEVLSDDSPPFSWFVKFMDGKCRDISGSICMYIGVDVYPQSWSWQNATAASEPCSLSLLETASFSRSSVLSRICRLKPKYWRSTLSTRGYKRVQGSSTGWNTEFEYRVRVNSCTEFSSSDSRKQTTMFESRVWVRNGVQCWSTEFEYRVRLQSFSTEFQNRV